MTPTPVPQGQYGNFPSLPTGVNASGGSASLGSLTATLSDYVNFYAALYYNNTQLLVILRPGVSIPAGGSLAVSVTFNATDTSGNSLPPVTESFSFQGPPAPPLAVSITTPPTAALGNVGNLPGDPGSATVQII
jgi:hypothetical protein